VPPEAPAPKPLQRPPQSQHNAGRDRPSAQVLNGSRARWCNPSGSSRPLFSVSLFFNALTDEEIAFYDALAENESARQVMGEPAPRVIATELVASIKGNVTVDWVHREAARA
jgi:Domain of unknown function (DUF3387)